MISHPFKPMCYLHWQFQGFSSTVVEGKTFSLIEGNSNSLPGLEEDTGFDLGMEETYRSDFSL